MTDDYVLRDFAEKERPLKDASVYLWAAVVLPHEYSSELWEKRKNVAKLPIYVLKKYLTHEGCYVETSLGLFCFVKNINKDET